jgi:hypothetical protein
MGGESWHEERERIIQLLEGIQSGAITHVDQANDRELAAVNPRNLALLEERLANLNARLGNEEK